MILLGLSALLGALSQGVWFVDTPHAEVCNLKPNPGPCVMRFSRYYYDPVTKYCKTFLYGGCFGNKNRFKTEGECMSYCHGATPTDFVCPTADGLFAHETDCQKFYQCTEYVPYIRTCGGGTVFNPATDVCDWPQNVDCGGDDPTLSLCEQPMEAGPCTYGKVTRYYFNKVDDTCEAFEYGGCRGNSNNFKTVKDCQAACPEGRLDSTDVCQLEKFKGPCDSYMARYYFNKDTGECERFIFGGCRSNGNNFRTQAECEETCRSD